MTETERTLRLIEATRIAWSRQSIDAFMQLVHPDIIWTININSNLGPTSETITGLGAVRTKAEFFKSFFEFEVFNVVGQGADGLIGHWRVKTRYRHRDSGQILETAFKVVFERTDDKLSMISEYVDAHYIEAFLRLVGQTGQNA